MMERLGKYQIIRVLGEGGMGRVYEAVDPMIGRHVAIKTISFNILDDPGVRARFLREAQAAGGLSHPNLITIHDIAEQDGLPYIVMEYLEGQDLSHVITSGRLTLDDKLRVMIEVCHGLAFAHARGVIHRDIKPPNIFLTAHGQIKVVDFGLARSAITEFTHTGKVLGTLNYMAPEQIRSEGTDSRADIFATGVVFYELLSGQKAFEGDSAAATIYKVLQSQLMPVHTIDAQLPPRLSEIIGHAIEKDRNRRYQTVDELLGDIVKLREDIASGVAGAGTSDQPPRDRRPTGETETVLIRSSEPAASASKDQPASKEQPAFTDQRARPFDWRWAAAILLVGGVVGIFLFARSMTPRPPEAAPSASSPVATQPATTPQPSTPPSSTPSPSTPPPSGRATVSPSAVAPPPIQPPLVARSAAPGAAGGPSGLVAGRGNSGVPTPTREPQSSAAGRPEPTAAGPEPPQRSSAEAASTPRTADAAGRESSPPRPVEPPAPRVESPRAPAPAAEPSPPPAAAAAPPPSPAAPAVAEAAVQAIVARYKAALESRDLGALKQIWPALVGRQEAAIKMEFDNARSIAVDFENVSVRVANTAATVTGKRNYIVTTVQGQTLRTATRMTMTLERRNGSWVIEAIRHEVER